MARCCGPLPCLTGKHRHRLWEGELLKKTDGGISRVGSVSSMCAGFCVLQAYLQLCVEAVMPAAIPSVDGHQAAAEQPRGKSRMLRPT